MRPGFLYYTGLVTVAMSLVILQVIYLALVAHAGYSTYRYVLRLPGDFAKMQLGILTIVVLATPTVAGVAVTFFLLKPLFAKAPAAVERLHLDRVAEPVLFAFVERLCTMLGAPAPTRIDIDLRANASASLRRGWRSLLSRDLVLTIGLPLATSLNVRQFGGVLAHEFGHFSQHAGMRLYFLIMTIRHWFARVAYERDEWDADLESWRKASGWQTKQSLTSLGQPSRGAGISYVDSVRRQYRKRMVQPPNGVRRRPARRQISGHRGFRRSSCSAAGAGLFHFSEPSYQTAYRVPSELTPSETLCTSNIPGSRLSALFGRIFHHHAPGRFRYLSSGLLECCPSTSW